MEKEITLREHLSRIGKSKSEKKISAVKENLKKANEALAEKLKKIK